MKMFKRPTAILAVAMLFALTPAMAEVFRVQLKNGNEFATRYQPKVAEWDENKVVLLTDVANRITLHIDDIADITHDSQMQGFGTVIDTTTIVLGWAPVLQRAEIVRVLEDDGRAGRGPAPHAARVAAGLSASRFRCAGRGGGLSPWEFGSNNFTGGPGNTPPMVVPVPQPSAGGSGGSGDGGQ